jgi:crossover junction endodeoxyribonuclease RusA
MTAQSQHTQPMPVAARTVTVTVPMAPPLALSTNQRSKNHWHTTREATKELREAAYWSAHDINYQQFGMYIALDVWTSKPVDVHEHIVWPKGQRRFDPDGLATLCKPALDGIVDAGLIPNDSAVYIRNLTTSQAVGDDGQGRIEVTLTEVTG